jgi:two-component system, NtrC family, nitrogen regulation response regulator GlnG
MSQMGRNVLIADDDASIRLVLSQALAREGYQVRATGNAATLWKWIKEGDGDLVLTDVMMPDGNLFDYLPRMRMERPKLPIIVMSAQNTLLTAVSAAEQGAYDYLPKPFDLDIMVGLVRRALDGKRDLNASNQQRKAEKDERLPLIGRSAAMQDVYRTLSRAAGFDLTVLIEGESGVGKKLVAQVLHNFGRRKDGPFVTLSLAALEPAGLDAAILGQNGSGIFDKARGGTLFLDGLADMPVPTQARLARILADAGEANTPLSDIRIIAATERDLKSLVASGAFREDLYYRLNVITIAVPPLRERLSDVPDLARAFLARATKDGLGEKALDKGGAEELEAWMWPGNVRELENLMRRIAALSPDPVIGADTIRRELFRERAIAAPSQSKGQNDDLESVARVAIARLIAQATASNAPLLDLHETVIAAVERPLFELTLRETRGNQIKAAEILGLNRNTLRKRLSTLDVETNKGRR